jgi:uncharacterized membrane protein YtjA (UPF0391 family)
MPGNLIYYALVLIVVAIVAGLLGFGGVASTAMSGAHLFVWVAVVILVIGVVFALLRRLGSGSPPAAPGQAADSRPDRRQVVADRLRWTR